jgi:hypothetical protein
MPKKSVREFVLVPIVREKSRHIVVVAELSGRRARMVIDTGAGGTVIDSGAVERFGLKLSKASRKGGGVGSVAMRLTYVAKHDLKIADLDLSDIKLLTLDLSHVNAVNREGETALMVAAENGNSGDIKALIESGADLNKTDLDGKTAWELTRDTEIRSLLESYGAIAKADRQN